jgi:hypothetical protein
MARSAAATVAEYLAELPPERRAVIAAVRDLVNRHLPPGYVEAMRWGMISWELPLERFPATYNGQPLGVAALAAQKSYYALYLPCADGDPAQGEALARAWRAAGKKLDMGKSCLRFRRLDDLVPDAVGAALAASPPEALVAQHEAAHGR